MQANHKLAADIQGIEAVVQGIEVAVQGIEVAVQGIVNSVEDSILMGSDCPRVVRSLMGSQVWSADSPVVIAGIPVATAGILEVTAGSLEVAVGINFEVGIMIEAIGGSLKAAGRDRLTVKVGTPDYRMELKIIGVDTPDYLAGLRVCKLDYLAGLKEVVR